MYLKIMGAENAPDADSRKTFTLWGDVVSVAFSHQLSGAVALMTFRDGTFAEMPVAANAYVLNDAGKTIEAFGSATLAEAA